MSNKKITVGAAALVAVIATAGFAFSSFAYQGDPSVSGPNINSETHKAMQEAFENKDFESWKANRPNQGKGRMMEVVNSQEAFEKFTEIREARLAGDIEKVESLRAELGLGQGNGEGRGQGMKNKGTRGQSQRGQNAGGKFIDANGNGVCDLME